MRLRILALAAALSTAAGAADTRIPIVVELFTSEGCSSCPPADALLQEITARMPAGVEIIPLSEHVDYWDHLGWRDPFSSSLFSARQQAYGDYFKSNNIYTPQMIVDGLQQFLGSDSEQARKAVRFAARQPKATVSVRLAGTKGRINVHVDELAEAKVDRADVFLVVTESGLANSVQTGENAGHRLTHTGVVRSLVKIVEIEAKQGAYVADLQVNLQPSWRRENLHAVILVQDRKTRRIAGAASCNL